MSEFDISHYQVDFVIITALRDELDAVREVFDLPLEHTNSANGDPYWFGRFVISKNKSYSIVVTTANASGNVNAAILTSKALVNWNPQAALLVGIAANTTGSIRFGDVIVGSTHYYSGHGKISESGEHEIEPDQTKPDPHFKKIFQRMRECTVGISRERPDKSTRLPAIHVAPMVVLDTVVQNQAVRDRAASWHRKNGGLEMEAYGFMHSAEDHFPKVRAIVIKAIQDDATTAKNDNWRSYSCAVAAACVKQFLLSRPIEPLNPKLAETHLSKTSTSLPALRQASSRRSSILILGLGLLLAAVVTGLVLLFQQTPKATTPSIQSQRYADSSDMFPLIREELKTAQHDVFFVGTSFHATIPTSLPTLKRKIEGGLHVRLLLFNPFCPNAEIAAKEASQSLAALKGDCIMTMQNLRSVMGELKNHANGGNLQIRVFSSVPRMRLYSFDRADRSGPVYLIHYVNGRSATNLPGVKHAATDHEQFDPYVESAERLWKEAVEFEQFIAEYSVELEPSVLNK
jgi:adenosylhomocysteine nucleosidase